MGLGGNVIAESVVYEDSMFGKSVSRGTISLAASDANMIMPSKQFSISMWVYIGADSGAAPGYNPIIFGINDLYRHHSLYAYPTVNDLHYSYMNSSRDMHGEIIEGALPSKEWTHIALAYNDPLIRVYVNGKLVKTDSFTLTYDSYNMKTPIYIYNSNVKNRAADIRIYDHCLSAKEIDIISRPLVFRQLLSRGVDPLVYNTEEYASFGLNDLSGFGHNLTTNGSVVWQTNSPLSYGSVAFVGKGYFSTSNIELTTPECNYTFWAKMSNWDSMPSGQSYPVLSFTDDLTEIKFVDGTIIATIETADSYCEHSSDVSTLSSGWHFFSVSYSGGSVEIRIDGSEITGTQFDETSNVETGSGDMVIGRDLEGNLANGLSLYDLRVYAKRLSTDDLTDLYIARIGIDNKGNLYAHNIEPNTDQIAFGANGVVKADIIESENGFRAYKDHIECTNFQEI